MVTALVFGEHILGMLVNKFRYWLSSKPTESMSESLESFEWLCHNMETFSALLALCKENPPIIGGFPSQRATNTDLWYFFVIIMDKQLNKQLSCLF